MGRSVNKAKKAKKAKKAMMETDDYDFEEDWGMES